jgi:CRP-like cAMP-binding protein
VNVSGLRAAATPAEPPLARHAILRRNAWFSGLSEALQRTIVERSVLRTWRSGEALFRENEPVRGLGVVLSGRVRFLVRYGAEGETVVHVGGAGCWFGLNAPRRGARSIATALADGRVQAMVLPVDAFERIVDEEPRHLRPFCDLMILSSERMMRYLGELPGLSQDGVLRVRLADLAARACADAGASLPVQVIISQADLASMVGMSRQRLNPRLRALQDEGLVKLGFRRIVVADPAALRASAGAAPCRGPARSPGSDGSSGAQR